MSAQDKVKELEGNILNIALQENGFRRKKKMFYSRMKGECTQSITLLDSKIRGQDRVYLGIAYGISYAEIMPYICYLEGFKYDKNDTLIQMNLTNLVKEVRPYGYYIDEKSDLETIAKDIIEKIKKYVVPIWNDNETLRDFMLHMDNKESGLGFVNKEWIFLALALKNDPNTCKEVLKEYQSVIEHSCKRHFAVGLESRIQRYIENGNSFPQI